jgi:ATP-dependent protease ClpP protease subunit
MYRLATNNEPSRPRDESDEEESSVENSGSRIFFYSEVTKDSVLSLNRQLRDLSIKLSNFSNAYEIPVPPIRLHINSPGGSLLDAFAAVDYVKACKVPVYSIIDGSAASAATIISVVANKRYMYKHSYMLIHQLSSGLYGKFEEQIDDFKNSETFMGAITEIYKQHTKIPPKTLKEILKRDIFFDAKTCLKYGLVDEVIGE